MPTTRRTGITCSQTHTRSMGHAPSTNFGVALTTVGDLAISSSSDTPAANRPELVVTYFP